MSTHSFSGKPSPLFSKATPKGDLSEIDQGDSAAGTPSFDSKNILIRASAGTGKTFQLAIRYIRLLRHAPPERILATTFTRKAAGEILERILLWLAQAANDERQLADLAEYVGPPPLERRECLHLLTALTRNLHRIRIGTLDSFFIRLAQSFSLELGLSPHWRILDPIEEDLFRIQAVQILLQKERPGDVIHLLNLLTKGHASRSVTTLLHSAVRNFYDVYRESFAEAWQTIHPPSLLDKPQLESAWEELLSAQRPQNKNWDQTFEKLLQIKERSDWMAFINETLVQKVIQEEAKYSRQEIPGPVRTAIQMLLKQAQAVLLRELAHKTEGTYELLHLFDQRFTKLKQSEHGASFQDVTRLLAQAWQHGILDHIDFRMDAKLDHLLLDEFQDTSITQWSVLKPLAERAAHLEHGSVFCVGDTKQSIYGWRGGVPELFDEIPHQLEQIQEQSLTRSYRSSQPVIDCVNEVFTHLTRHPNLSDALPAIADWESRFPKHSTVKKNLRGHVTLQAGPALPEEWLPWITNNIRQVHEQLPAASIGILTQKNNTVSEIARALRQAGVSASEEGGSLLNDSVAVRTILEVLRFIDHPSDTAASFHLYHSPLRDKLALSDPFCATACSALAAELRRQIHEQGLAHLIELWSRELVEYCDARGALRLRQLLSKARAYETMATMRMTDFVELVEQEPVDQPSESLVRVMTIHQAKGLQFDIVFLPELDSKLIAQTSQFVASFQSYVDPPTHVLRYANKGQQSIMPLELQEVYQQDYSRKISERLSVLYVAMTRAIHALHMLIEPTTTGANTFRLCFSHLIRAAITDQSRAEAETILYSHGDADWAKHHPELSRTIPGAEETSTPPLPFRIRLAPSQEVPDRGLERIAPSQHTPEKLRAGHLLKPFDDSARDRGTLIHAWLEQIEWIEDPLPGDERFLDIAKTLGIEDHEARNWHRDFLQMISLPGVRQMLSQSRYTGRNPCGFTDLPVSDEPNGRWVPVVQRERHITTRIGKRIVSGVIDRLVLLMSADQVLAAELIDFKTDRRQRIPQEEFQQRRQGYHEQLRFYAEAIAHLYNLSPRRLAAHLLFLEDGQTEQVVLRES